MSRQFLITAYDYTDEAALERRMAARPAHAAQMEMMHAEGTMLFAAAILDDGEKMIGSSVVCQFSDRAELDSWLEAEPYVTGRVWERIEVKLCAVGKIFVKD